MLHSQSNRNSSELIRTDPDTDGKRRKQTKQIQKLSNVKILLENCSGKRIFDNVQIFRHLSEHQRTKNARNTHDEHTPLLELNVHRSEVRRHRRLETNPSTMLPYLHPNQVQVLQHCKGSQPHLDELATFRKTVRRVGNTFPVFQGQATSPMEVLHVMCSQFHVLDTSK